jgi:hypothetical protein
MIGNRPARVLGAAVAASALLIGAGALAGCATQAKPAAQTKPAASVATATSAATPAATAGRPAGGTVHIIDYSINSDGPYLRAILTGAIGDYGPAVTVYPDGRVDPQHTSQMRLSLTHGSFRLGIGALDKQIVKAYSHWPVDRATCSGSISFTITAPVVPGSGTGMYRGISGSFSVTVTIDEVDVKPVCDGTSRFLAQVILMTGTGTVAFR